MRATLLLSALVLLAGAFPPGVRAQSSSSPSGARERAAEMLDLSPVLLERSGIAGEARFVRQARALLAASPETAEAARSISTVEDATLALERALEGTTVFAVVRSTPSPLVVTYRRLVDERAPQLTVTTDDSIPLQPALYLFTATDPASGRVQEQKKSCAAGCSVVFRFP